ncbi:MAG: hypothetical protein FJ202_00530 [Gemmatimonadetes bacterium]|nr:hypothetical protein [Gemmatimonadota bacterium]
MSVEPFFRKALLGILVLVLVGTEIELILLKHYEDVWQLVPMVLLPVSLVVLTWHGLSAGSAALKALRVVMVLLALSGGVGVIQHYRTNLLDASESNPSLAGTELYLEALEGSIPALAPGTMLQIGLLGLLFTYRHPRLGGHTSRSTTV